MYRIFDPCALNSCASKRLSVIQLLNSCTKTQSRVGEKGVGGFWVGNSSDKDTADTIPLNTRLFSPLILSNRMYGLVQCVRRVVLHAVRRRMHAVRVPRDFSCRWIQHKKSHGTFAGFNRNIWKQKEATHTRGESRKVPLSLSRFVCPPITN